ncbi:MAG: EAL domain-containing protein [Acidobacteriota bacterium]
MTPIELAFEWLLEGLVAKRLVRARVRKLPFVVGRRPELDLTLDSPRVSQRHAELVLIDGQLTVRDLGSTNGTFINGERLIGERSVVEGDRVQFADLVFQLSRLETIQPVEVSQTLALGEVDLGGLIDPSGLRELLREDVAQVAYQPLVRPTGHIMGFEVLGRGSIEGLASSVGDLFRLAEQMNMEIPLSEAFRRRGAEEARKHFHFPTPSPPDAQAPLRIFLNTHPAELGDLDGLLRSLDVLRTAHPEVPLVLEIHEAAVTDSVRLHQLRQGLRDLGVRIAFDDFGTGQTRLLELADVQPEYLKFDVVWIRDIHQASPQRREMIDTMVRMVRDMRIETIAEGIETREEADACTAVGFTYFQGYFCGRPMPANKAAALLAAGPA